jgi:hypothetical protein
MGRQNPYHCYIWGVDSCEALAKSPPNRDRLNIDMKGLRDAVNGFKDSVEWAALAESSKVRVLLIERMALGPDIRRTMEEIKAAVELGDIEAAIAQLNATIDLLTGQP